MHNILITGVSSGLGHALAEVCLERGYRVYATGRHRPSDIEHPNFHFFACDLSDLKSLRACVTEGLQGVDQLEAVILNAGMLGEIKPMVETSVEALKKICDLNVWANKLLLDLLIARELRVKQVIGISSGAAVNASKGWGGYSLSKSALNMLLRLYAHEMPSTHLTALAPGVIDTPMVRYILEEVDETAYPSAGRLKRGPIMTPQEAAKRLVDTIPKLLRYESGAFVDIREMEIYTKEELELFRELEKSVEEGRYKPLAGKELEKEQEIAAQIAKKTIEKRTKKKSLNLRVYEEDIERIKAMALHQGLPYQTFLSSIIHKIATKQIEV